MYGQKILGIDLKLSRQYKESLFDGNELMRMGFTRLNINYFFNDQDVDYILNAVEFVARYGHLLLPHYKFDLDDGSWTNRDEKE